MVYVYDGCIINCIAFSAVVAALMGLFLSKEADMILTRCLYINGRVSPHLSDYSFICV